MVDEMVEDKNWSTYHLMISNIRLLPCHMINNTCLTIYHVIFHLIDHLINHLIISSLPISFLGVQHVMNPDMYRGMFADLEDGVDRWDEMRWEIMRWKMVRWIIIILSVILCFLINHLIYHLISSHLIRYVQEVQNVITYQTAGEIRWGDGRWDEMGDGRW